MDTVLGFLSGWWWVLSIPVLLAVLVFFGQWMLGIVLIGEDQIGVVNLHFNLFGKNKTLPDGKIIALEGESGYQADTLAPGLYFFYWPWQYSVEKHGFFLVPQGMVGLVEAVDGVPIPVGRVLGRAVNCDTFQSAREFLKNGGERGPQLAILPPGTYRINTALFKVTPHKATQVPENSVGIVTTFEGQPLDTGEIAGSEVAGHNMFQNGQKFLDNGGRKGLQVQVMLAGTYYLNPRFVSVQQVEMTLVPIGYVGVIVAYVGTKATKADADFKHGHIVKEGEKGVWGEPLNPGKHAINTHTHKVELVPTTNIVLNWAEAKTESHKLDENLSTIIVRSSDGFTFNLDVSQIIHISRNDAAKVIARFGNMRNLVTQVLEPLIGNYFRNGAQKYDIIDFLKGRAERQAEARTHIEAAISAYNVQAVDTLIGDIVPPAELMKTLTDRKIATQQQETYKVQGEAEKTRQELERQKAEANTRADVVNAERRVTIAELDAQSAIKKAEGDAKSKTINAEADATVLITVGKAEGEKITAVGQAEADVLQKKVTAVGGGNYSAMQVAQSLSNSRVPIVPEIFAGGGADGQGGSMMNAFLGTFIANSVKQDDAKPAEVTAT